MLSEMYINLMERYGEKWQDSAEIDAVSKIYDAVMDMIKDANEEAYDKMQWLYLEIYGCVAEQFYKMGFKEAFKLFIDCM